MWITSIIYGKKNHIHNTTLWESPINFYYERLYFFQIFYLSDVATSSGFLNENAHSMETTV